MWSCCLLTSFGLWVAQAGGADPWGCALHCITVYDKHICVWSTHLCEWCCEDLHLPSHHWGKGTGQQVAVCHKCWESPLFSLLCHSQANVEQEMLRLLLWYGI